MSPSRISSPETEILSFFKQVVVLDVLIENAGQSRVENPVTWVPPCRVADVIDIGVEIFGIGIIPLHRHFELDRTRRMTLFDAMNVDRLWEKRDFVFIQIRDKRSNSAFIAESKLRCGTVSRSSRKMILMPLI